MIKTTHLFGKLNNMLIELLESLTPEEWNMPTIARLWTVKDIASHILDGNLRTLSMSRDKYFGEQPGNIERYEDLVMYLNSLNADWVKATKRLSPQVLTALLALSGKQFEEHSVTLDPHGKAVFSVAWAGETQSQNWFHIAREYTEKFIHQQQIREAVNKPGLLTAELFYPFINTFMQGLPYTYRNMEATEGTTIRVNVSTDIGGNWFIKQQKGSWVLMQENTYEPHATITIDPDTAWKLFSKGITPEMARQKVVITGKEDLAEKALTMVSVVA